MKNRWEMRRIDEMLFGWRGKKERKKEEDEREELRFL